MFSLNYAENDKQPEDSLEELMEDLDIIYSPSFYHINNKMADVDINPFGEQNRTELRTETGENIPFTPIGGGRSSTWEPEREQETSFRGES